MTSITSNQVIIAFGLAMGNIDEHKHIQVMLQLVWQ